MYFKNINESIAPASLTKLMTSLILIENYNLSDYIEISLPSDYLYEGKVAYLKPGQRMTVESLLEFILIYSANDACFAVVQLFSENNDDFLNLMNKKARVLGMNNTNFKGSIHVIIGCMFSGKTTELLRNVKRYKSIGKTTMVLNYSLDERYGKDSVISHDSLGVPAHMISDFEELYTNSNLNHEYNNSEYIFINEGQFFKNLNLQSDI